MKDTEVGRALTDARIDLVRSYTDPALHTDVGIGNGDFVEKFGCYGDDINPFAIKWLQERNAYKPLLDGIVRSASFWDVLEHVPEPGIFLRNIESYCFISMPIYTSVGDVLKSKHFRKDEHYWYPTHDGLCHLMSLHNFSLIYHDDRESVIGRESIGSYVFLRNR